MSTGVGEWAGGVRRAAISVLGWGVVTTIFLGVPLVTLAQAPPVAPAQIARLEVVLWPEYDQPAVLVTYKAQLAAGTPLPTSVTLPIPAAAGEPHAVAKRGLDSQLYTAEFHRSVNGEWAQIEITTDQLGVHLEYYIALDIDGDRRRYEYRWPGGLSIGELVYVVQQPAGATDFTMQPAATGSRVDPRSGLTYHSYRVGRVGAGEAQAFSFSYAKSSAALTVSTLQPRSPTLPSITPPSSVQRPAPSTPMAQATAEAPGGWDDENWFDLIITALVVGVFSYWIARRRSAARTERKV